MKYRQTCPECYFELLIDSMDDAVKVCPKCKGRDIAKQKIVIVEEHRISESEEKTIFEESEGEAYGNDNDMVSEWGDILANVGHESLIKPVNESISLEYVSGIIHGSFNIIIDSDDCPCLLGRSGIGREYFQYDPRVSNEHCYIMFSEGEWYIKDNNSTNGTRKNRIPIQPQVEVNIKNGDLIKLGKSEDSVELEVRINAIS